MSADKKEAVNAGYLMSTLQICLMTIWWFINSDNPNEPLKTLNSQFRIPWRVWSGRPFWIDTVARRCGLFTIKWPRVRIEECFGAHQEAYRKKRKQFNRISFRRFVCRKINDLWRAIVEMNGDCGKGGLINLVKGVKGVKGS